MEDIVDFLAFSFAFYNHKNAKVSFAEKPKKNRLKKQKHEFKHDEIKLLRPQL